MNIKLQLKEVLKYKEGRELILLLLGLVAVISFGTVGYELVEGWNFFDSFYMTIITLAAIGYAEVHPLSDTGRIFTVILIFLGVTICYNSVNDNCP